MSPVTSNTTTWVGSGVAISEVVTALEELRRQEQRASTRTSVATLIMVARSSEEVEAAETVVDHLGVRHPARIVTLLVPEGAGDGPDCVDAEVSMHAGEAEGHAIWSDQIRLTVSGGPARHRASLLRPLMLGDLPVVVWYVTGLPDEGDPLLKLANAVIVDTKTAPAPGEGEPAIHRAFEQVGALIRRNTIIDLSWNRLEPWRRLLASQFEGDVYRPFVANVERVEVTGKLAPRTILAGWLASRLQIGREDMHLYDGRHVSIKLHCRSESESAQFVVERTSGERMVRSSAAIDDGPSHTELLGLPDDALPYALSSALKKLERDRVYEQAIKLAGGWL